MADAPAIFLPEGPGVFAPTELARGPWDPGALHGGPPAALLADALEQVAAAAPMAVVRLTVEFVRPVPLAPLRVETAVTRPGRRVQLLEARLLAGADVVCRATALRVRVADVPGPRQGAGFAAPRGPDDSRPAVMTHFADGPPSFARDGMEIRFAEGEFDTTGPATAWLRLRVPLVAGARTTPLQRLAAAADFGNGISAAVPWSTHVFINPDLTVYAARLPAGEWVGLNASTRVGDAGAGLAESLLFDERGTLGRSLQALYVDVR